MFLIENTAEYQLPWEPLEALIRGISAVDLNEMPLHSREEAIQFLLSYGYNLNLESDAQELHHTLRSAVHFIELRFLNDESVYPESLTMPHFIKEAQDVVELLLTASSPIPSQEKYWACAVLKVMHIMCHIDNVPLYQYFDKARDQILNRFYALLSRNENGDLILGKSGDGPFLRLYDFETKDQKPRDSIMVKLLCKKENVAEGVWDLIGVRFITHTPAEAIHAIHILQKNQVILFPNIIPSRSRNTLLNFEKFRTRYQAILTRVDQGEASLAEIEALFKTFDAPPDEEAKDFKNHNPATSGNYRSIHITSRQLIRIPGSEPGMETRFFFPFEIQVMDKASYLESKEGSSAHSLYKRKQLTAARRRVLGPLLLPSKSPPPYPPPQGGRGNIPK